MRSPKHVCNRGGAETARLASVDEAGKRLNGTKSSFECESQEKRGERRCGKQEALSPDVHETDHAKRQHRLHRNGKEVKKRGGAIRPPGGPLRDN